MKSKFPMPRRGLMHLTSSGAMIAEGAVVTGDVNLGLDVSVWFGCVIRGDDAAITVGDSTNIQDGTVIHCDTDAPQVIGRNCTIGHRAVLHGISIGDGVLIGMSATILGGAVIGDGAVVAAGSLVKENFRVPSNMLVAGVPARIIREVSPSERKFMHYSIPHYVEAAKSYLA